jgi:hypothetical protein
MSSGVKLDDGYYFRGIFEPLWNIWGLKSSQSNNEDYKCIRYCFSSIQNWTVTFLIWLVLWCLNATINKISVISWRSALLAEETGMPGEIHGSAVSHWQTLSHNVVHLTMSG